MFLIDGPGCDILIMRRKKKKGKVSWRREGVNAGDVCLRICCHDMMVLILSHRPDWRLETTLVWSFS
jgi:hypothetical protein